MAQDKAVVVAGVGPGNGAALARRFAGHGRRLALLSRNRQHAEEIAAELPGASAFTCDVSDAASVESCFQDIATECGEVGTLLFNARSGVFADVEAITAGQFQDAWRVNALGLFLCSRQVIPAMKAAGTGQIVVVGATASRRGGKATAAFAPAKAAQRSLAESMARSLWPAGIHVSLIIVDGVVDLTGDAREDARQARRVLRRSGGRRRDRVGSHAAASDGLELRGGGPAVRRELVADRKTPISP